jgi:hypothetical protein
MTGFTVTSKPHAELRILDPRLPSARDLFRYDNLMPLTKMVLLYTVTLLPTWFLVFRVNTPGGPITTWSMSVSFELTGTL